jgi:uncharacterized protein YcfJ
MKRFLLAISVIAGAPALADHAAPESVSPKAHYVYADVVDVDPIVKRRIVRTPREVCEQYARHRVPDDEWSDYEPGPGPSIIGGLIGGLIGHHFGRGHGREAFTVAGALAGASIAGAAARENHRGRHARTDRSGDCYTVTDEEVVRSTEGYRVTYAYHGRRFVKEMDSYPDDKIRIRVRVSPEF